METKIVGNIVFVKSETPLITDAQSALDLIASVGYEHNVTKIAIDKTAISEDFFKLSTGFAGEIVQKFVNYGYQLAIIGDFSGYTSEALRAYIKECNKGNHLYFVSNENEAISKMSGATDG